MEYTVLLLSTFPRKWHGNNQKTRSKCDSNSFWHWDIQKYGAGQRRLRLLADIALCWHQSPHWQDFFRHVQSAARTVSVEARALRHLLQIVKDFILSPESWISRFKELTGTFSFSSYTLHNAFHPRSRDAQITNNKRFRPSVWKNIPRCRSEIRTLARAML
jgi:hypothetical protein